MRGGVTIIKKMVLFECAVPCGFHHQMRLYAVPVELNALVDHVPITHAVEAVVSATGGDELREGHAGPRVGHDRRPRMLPQHDGSHQRDLPVAVDGGAGAVDDAAPVDVGVEDDAEVGLLLEDGRSGERHGGAVLRVGNVVGEHPVGFQVEAAEGIGSQLVQHVPGEETPGTISSVHYHLQEQFIRHGLRSFVCLTP